MTKEDEAQEAEGAQPHDDVEVPSAWEWIDDPPTTEQVVEKLRELDDWFGVRPEKYVDYVQPLSQSKNISQERGRKEYKTTWSLYITVAGRIALLRDMATVNGLQVNFVPEETTPTGMPGYLVHSESEDRIVYREYVEIWQETSNGPTLLRRAPGTAWVPFKAGGGAVGSNRYEKVETSARGRAIAALGIGVLPGSGVASLEEMQDAIRRQNAPQDQGNNRGRGRGAEPREPVDRQSVDAETRRYAAEYEQAAELEEGKVDEKVRAYCAKTFDKEVTTQANGALSFVNLTDGELVILRNRLKKEVEQVKLDKGEL